MIAGPAVVSSCLVVLYGLNLLAESVFVTVIGVFGGLGAMITSFVANYMGEVSGFPPLLFVYSWLCLSTFLCVRTTEALSKNGVFVGFHRPQLASVWCAELLRGRP